jgi:hypothetical protein
VITSDPFSQEFFQQNSIWDLNAITVAKEEFADSFGMVEHGYEMEALVFYLHVKRRPLFFVINGLNHETFFNINYLIK